MGVVLHAEEVHDGPLGAELFQFVQRLAAPQRQGILDLGGVGLGQVGIAAVGEELGRFLKGGRVQHPPGPVAAEKPWLSCPQHGGQAQIRFFFLSQCFPSRSWDH